MPDGSDPARHYPITLHRNPVPWKQPPHGGAGYTNGGCSKRRSGGTLVAIVVGAPSIVVEARPYPVANVASSTRWSNQSRSRFVELPLPLASRSRPTCATARPIFLRKSSTLATCFRLMG